MQKVTIEFTNAGLLHLNAKRVHSGVPRSISADYGGYTRKQAEKRFRKYLKDKFNII